MKQNAVTAILERSGASPKKVEQFLAWHNKSPQVWKEFEQVCLSLACSGEKWGAMAALNIVRWESMKRGDSEDFKVNNTWAPYYARIFITKHPEYKDFFELRELKS